MTGAQWIKLFKKIWRNQWIGFRDNVQERSPFIALETFIIYRENNILIPRNVIGKPPTIHREKNVIGKPNLVGEKIQVFAEVSSRF